MISTEARIKARKAISSKKVSFFEEKLNQNIGKPKELWKTLKDLGLPNKKSTGSTKVCLKKENGDICFDSNSNSEIFMNFFPIWLKIFFVNSPILQIDIL